MKFEYKVTLKSGSWGVFENGIELDRTVAIYQDMIDRIELVFDPPPVPVDDVEREIQARFAGRPHGT